MGNSRYIYGISAADLKQNLGKWLRNPAWREYYETAPSELCKLLISMEFYESEHESDTAANAIKIMEERLSIEDWRHLYRYCGNNPRKGYIHDRIMDLERKHSSFPCHICEIQDAHKAYDELKIGWAKEYGDNVSLEDGTVLHWNHVWDDGKRLLIRCRICGGLFLIQCSEFHSVSDAPDGYYEDWIPVSSVEEADLMNILYEAWELDNYDIRHMLNNNGKLHWKDGPAPRPHDPEKLRDEIRKKYSKLNKKQKEMLEKLMAEAGKEAGP